MDEPVEDDGLARAGDLAQLQGSGHKSHLITLVPGGVLQTHRGVIRHDEIIGKPWGSRLQSHQGNPFYLFKPGLADLISQTKRTTQIMYPKEIGYILVKLGIGPGTRVLECGTGSGGLPTALAYMVGDTGRVYSYERNPGPQEVAKANLNKLGLAHRVNFRLGNAEEGFAERNLDALFLDLPNPYDYLGQVRASLKGGAHLGLLLPTSNQVVLTLEALKSANFAFIEVLEILIRYWKSDWKNFRPVDRMIAHTGYLVFARPVDSPLEDEPVLDSEPEADREAEGE